MPAKLTDMAISVAEKVDASRPFTAGTPPEEMPDYPHGLTIYLTTDDLMRLGINKTKLDAEERVVGNFIGAVTDVNTNRVNGQVKYRCTIQIQQLGLELQPEQDRADQIYGKTT